MLEILCILYIPLSYWAMKKLWWSKHEYFYVNGLYFYLQRWFFCLIFGLVTIPIAIIATIIENRN